MADKGTPATIRSWLEEEFSAAGWHSAVVAQELSEDVLDIVAMQFKHYEKATKIGVLFSFLYIRKGELSSMMDSVTKVIDIACNDTDEWVRLLGSLLQNFPETKRLNIKCKEWSEQAQPILTYIQQIVQEQGFGFHPSEFTVIQPNTQPQCHFTNASYRSMEPTIAKHFQHSDNDHDIISDSDRQKRFKMLLQAEEEMNTMMASSSLTSPTTFSAPHRFPLPSNTQQQQAQQPLSSTLSSTASTHPNINSSINVGRPPSSHLYGRPSGMANNTGGVGTTLDRAGLRPPAPRPRPGTAATSSSLFIQRPLVRKHSLGADGNRPSFLRPSGPPRFSRPPVPGVSTNASMNVSSVNQTIRPPPPPRQEGSIPKGFIKQSRVQMLDFDDASTLQESNSRAIDTAMQDLKNEKEARKLQLAEERRLAAEKRKLDAQKEKEEREATKRRKTSKGNASASALASENHADGSTATTATTAATDTSLPLTGDAETSQDQTVHKPSSPHSPSFSPTYPVSQSQAAMREMSPGDNTLGSPTGSQEKRSTPF